MTHELALHKLHRTMACLFLQRGSSCSRRQITETRDNDKIDYAVQHFWLNLSNHLFLYIKLDQNEQLFQLYSSQSGVILTSLPISPVQRLEQLK